jgi:hypothetical protein
MRCVIATLLLVLLNSAAFAAPKCSFESVVSWAQANAVPATLPPVFARVMGFPEAELAVKRASWHLESADIFRAVDILPGTSDFVLFIRRRQEVMMFWRVSSSGQIRTTAVSDTQFVKAQNNSTHVADYEALLDYFCEQIAKQEKSNSSPK